MAGGASDFAGIDRLGADITRAGEDTSRVERVSRLAPARRRRAGPMPERFRQRFGAVALRMLEDDLEQRLERLADARSGRDPEQPHHVPPVQGEIPNAERVL